jgi:hypothetical protein
MYALFSELVKFVFVRADKPGNIFLAGKAVTLVKDKFSLQREP